MYALDLLMPTQILESPAEQTELDRMLVRLLLVAELLLNPTAQSTDPDPQDSEIFAKSSQESDVAQADV